MIFSITIASAAEDELLEAYEWYKRQNEELASDFEICFSKAVESIHKNPFKTQIKYETIRVFFLQKFPYGIHFKVEVATILIIAVFHTSINPKRWEKR